MSDSLKELLWMTGCTTVMVAVGLIALIGYMRLRQSESDNQAPELD